jgi:hypothetical protein
MPKLCLVPEPRPKIKIPQTTGTQKLRCFNIYIPWIR